jgi:hypothetical protein
VRGSNDETLRFIGSSFRSVWALELLLVLKGDRPAWTCEDLVTSLRASDLVVAKALEGLEAAGLVSNGEAGVQYMPVSDEVSLLVEQAEALYAPRPDAVRRAIISSSAGDAAAFVDAFRFRKG